MNEVGKVTAHLVRESKDGISWGLVKSGALVPAIMDRGLLDVPKVIQIGKEHFILVDSQPLTYVEASFAEANEVIDGEIIKTLTETI